MTYEDLLARLPEGAVRLWMRVLVLGSTPEFCLLDPEAINLPELRQTVLVQQTPVWPDGN